MRVATVFLQPPKHRRKSENCLPIKVQGILAVEENPPIGEKAVCWLLLTTLSVSNWEQVCQCLLWYSYRWLIERFHYVLKSGCHLEELQLSSADRIQRAVATYGIVEKRLLWLTNGSTSQS
ncbi:MAG: transposase [Symploca sp. SIO2D2]|nr:transposase [Symploca sp. SIO2D2]